MYEYIILFLLGILVAYLDKGLSFTRKGYTEWQTQRQRGQQEREEQQRRQEEQRRHQDEENRRRAEEQRRATGASGSEKGVDDLLTYLRDVQSNIWKPGEGLGNRLEEVLNRIVTALESNQIIKDSLQEAATLKVNSRKDPRYGKYINIKIIIRFILHSDRITDPSKKTIYDQIISAFEEYFTSRGKDVQDLRDSISQILSSRGTQSGERSAADDFEDFRRNL